MSVTRARSRAVSSPARILQQRRLAGAVRRDDADAVQRADRARHAVEHDVRAERLGRCHGRRGSERGSGGRHGGTCDRAGDERLGRRPITTSGAGYPACQHRRRDSRISRSRPTRQLAWSSTTTASRRHPGGRRPAAGRGVRAGPPRRRRARALRPVGLRLLRGGLAAGAARRLPGSAIELPQSKLRDVTVPRLPARRREPPAGAAARGAVRRFGAARGAEFIGGAARRRCAFAGCDLAGADFSNARCARPSTCAAPASTGCAASGRCAGATIGVEQLFGLAPGARRGPRPAGARRRRPGDRAGRAELGRANADPGRYNRRAPPRANVVPRWPVSQRS